MLLAKTYHGRADDVVAVGRGCLIRQSVSWMHLVYVQGGRRRDTLLCLQRKKAVQSTGIVDMIHLVCCHIIKYNMRTS